MARIEAIIELLNFLKKKNRIEINPNNSLKRIICL